MDCGQYSGAVPGAHAGSSSSSYLFVSKAPNQHTVSLN